MAGLLATFAINLPKRIDMVGLDANRLAGAGVPPNALVSRTNNQPLVSRDNGAIFTARAA